MEVFTQFSSDLDEATKKQLVYGQGLMRLLRQPQYSPIVRHRQVILLTAALNKLLLDIPLHRLDEFREGMLKTVEEQNRAACGRIDRTGELTEEDKANLLRSAREYTLSWIEAETGGKLHTLSADEPAGGQPEAGSRSGKPDAKPEKSAEKSPDWADAKPANKKGGQ